jgi:hypothetical protein
MKNSLIYTNIPELWLFAHKLYCFFSPKRGLQFSKIQLTLHMSPCSLSISVSIFKHKITLWFIEVNFLFYNSLTRLIAKDILIGLAAGPPPHSIG